MLSSLLQFLCKDESCHGHSSITVLKLCRSLIIICGVNLCMAVLPPRAGESNRWEESFKPDNGYQLCPRITMPWTMR